MKAVLKKYLGWVISAAFLGLVLSHIEWGAFIESLKRISPFEVVGLCAIYLLGFLVRGQRCRVLLPELRYIQGLKAVCIGYAANNLLPARLGEVVRAQVVGNSCGIRRSTTLSSILIERVFDGVAIVALLVIGSTAVVLPLWAQEFRFAGIAIFSLALIGVIVLGIWHQLWRRFLPQGKLGEIGAGLLDGLALATRDVQTIAFVIIYSFLVWFIEGVMFWYGFHVFQINLDLYAALFVLGVVNLGVLIPSSPGNVGVFQFFCVKALGIHLISGSEAMAYAVVLHVCQYLPVTVLGVMALHSLGFKSFSAVHTE